MMNMRGRVRGNENNRGKKRATDKRWASVIVTNTFDFIFSIKHCLFLVVLMIF